MKIGRCHNIGSVFNSNNLGVSDGVDCRRMVDTPEEAEHVGTTSTELHFDTLSCFRMRAEGVS